MKIRVLLVALLSALPLAVASCQPAAATIGTWHWSRATIYVQDDTANPGVGWDAYIQGRVTYYQDMPVAWHVIKGKCQIGYPCVVTKAADYGTAFGLGQTTYAKLCSTNTFCNFTGVSGTWTVARFNTGGSPAGTITTAQEVQALGCHEAGHALAYLQHMTGATCMQSAIGTSTPITLSSGEVQEIADRYYSTPYITR